MCIASSFHFPSHQSPDVHGTWPASNQWNNWYIWWWQPVSYMFGDSIGTLTEYEYCYHFVDTTGRETVFDLLVLEDLGSQYRVILQIDGAGRGAPDVGQCPNRDSSGNCCERVGMNVETGLPLTVTISYTWSSLWAPFVVGFYSPGYKVSSPTDYQLNENDTVSKEDLGTDGEPDQLSDISLRFIVQLVESPGSG